jgi:NADPH:quinone reductase-like Zn-dependent oxidoreductase
LKALIQTDYGDPAKVLELREVPAAIPENDQAIVDIETAVVHVADAHTVLGADGFRKKLPRTPGYEGVGRVCAVGRDVKGVVPGMRVFAPIGSGTYREQIAVIAADLVPAPEGDPVQLALLSLSPATAMLMLQDFAKLQPGDFVVQNASSSAVGRMVIQLANDMNVKVVNVVKSSVVIPELKELGAGVVLLDTPDLRDRVAAVTQSSPVKLALDAVGGAATGRIAACLDENATIVSYGSMSGEPCHMPADLLGARGIRLVGIHPARQLAKHTLEERNALYLRFGDLLKAGKLRGRLGATYTLENAVDAIRHVLRDGDKRIGRVVIRVREVAVPAEAPPPAATQGAAVVPAVLPGAVVMQELPAAASAAASAAPATAATTAPASPGEAAPPGTSTAGAA